VGIFASNGNEITFFNQLKGVVVIGLFAFISSFLTLFVINWFFNLRASKDEEMQGLDVKECGLEAYPEFKRAF
jgi:Amt family ammonium transporter